MPSWEEMQQQRRNLPAKRYEEEMGRKPPALPEDDPLRWQWDYRGTKKERDALKEELEWVSDPDAEIEGQEALL